MLQKMLHKIFFLISIFLAGVLSAYSQHIVTGKVTTDDKTEGIPGVNILLKGTFDGTISDMDGKYSIEVPYDSSVIVFSFIGYNTEEYEVGKQTTIDVIMIPSIEALDEVVITALGIKRAEKALGYSVQKVDGEEIAKVKELDIVNALSGKVSGVNIIQADGSVGGGGSRIVIRGESSLAGNNDPLYIINGIPGSANDIAPDDIESISVLKGPAASALYGSKAGAGVVLITSKSGKDSEGLQVDFNSNITFQTPLVLPEYQNKYGIGSGNAYSYLDGNTNDDPYWDDTRYSWGPEFDGELRAQFNGNNPWVAYPNSVKDFYQTGHIYIHNISISNSTDMGNFRFSYSNTDQRGILPNNGIKKNNLSLNSQFKFKKRLTVTTNISYLRTNGENTKKEGEASGTSDVRFIPRGVDISALKDYWVPGMEGLQQLNYRRSSNNPYFELYENPYSYIDSKVIANITANLDITEQFSFMGRFGTNYTNNEYYDKHAKSTYNLSEPRDLEGYYKSGLANTWDRTAEFLFSYEEKFFDAIGAKLSAGGTHYRSEYRKLEGSAYSLTYLDLYNLNNRDDHIYIDDNISKLERNSLYAFLNLDYSGMLFFDFTRRDDWSSTLHPDNNHFSYHSAVVSALISNMISLPKAISFCKVRGSFAQVGNDIPVPYYTIEDKYLFRTSSDGLTYVDPSDTKTNPYLKPEITTGSEAGLDIRFFNNRLGFDITYYHSITENQILKTKKSIASGGQDFFTTNAGKIKSEGIELTLNTTPIKAGYFKWETQLNWSLDRSYLVEFNDTIPSKTQQVNAHLAIEDRPGQRRGTFYGRAYEYAPNGKRLYSLSGDTRLTEATQLGNYNPDWMASLNNTVSYKNLSLSFLLDLRWGGLIYNETERKLNMYGLSEATLLNDREGIVPEGMVELEDGTYRELTLADLEAFGKIGGQSGQEYWANQMEETAPQNVLVNNTYLKLREVRFAYQLPQKWTRQIFIRSVTFAVVGRNLAVWSRVKHTDPETYGIASDKNDFGFDTKVPGYANSRLPSVRSFGFTLNCNF